MMRFRFFLARFKQNRQPGDVVFSALFLLFAVFLLLQIETQITWLNNVRLFAQPGFWSIASVVGMSFFALLYFIGSVLSCREHRNFGEVAVWIKSFEYALWFLVYVWMVPVAGYLPSTLLFVGLLALRTGYRDRVTFMAAGAAGFAIVVIFKAFLGVKIPGGALYSHLPDAMRGFMNLYL